jgi:hypothetical protein
LAKKISRIDRRFAAYARLKNKKSAGKGKTQQRQKQRRIKDNDKSAAPIQQKIPKILLSGNINNACAPSPTQNKLTRIFFSFISTKTPIPTIIFSNY